MKGLVIGLMLALAFVGGAIWCTIELVREHPTALIGSVSILVVFIVCVVYGTSKYYKEIKNARLNGRKWK